MIKRVFAFVTEKEFYIFRQKAHNKKLTMGEVFSALIIEFNQGRITLDKEIKENKKETTNVYLEAVKRRTISRGQTSQ